MVQETLKISNRSVAIISSLLIAGLIAGGAWWWSYSSRIVSTDDARIKGTIVAVSAKASGRLEHVLVNEGDIVKTGQVIATLEKAECEALLEQAKASLAVAQAKLAVLKAGNRPQEIAQARATVRQAAANWENSRKNFERAEALYNQGAISVQQRDSLRTATDIAHAQYTATEESYSLSSEGTRVEEIQMAEAQVQQVQAALKTAHLQLDNTVIKSPVSGVIALKSIEPGEVISAGQPLFSITNLADIWIAANIDETNIGKIKIGHSVDFTIDAYPNRKFSGEVIDVGSATASQFSLFSSENSSGNFTKVMQRLPIKIKAGNYTDISLKPGMSAVVAIHIR